MTSRPSFTVPILAILAILFALLGAYVGGYFWLGKVDTVSRPGTRERFYNRQWLCVIYKPLGKVETWLTGNGVDINYRPPIPVGRGAREAPLR